MSGFLERLRMGNRIAELEAENEKFKEMVEDMKADMCGTESKELFDYLSGILIKYGEVI